LIEIRTEEDEKVHLISWTMIFNKSFTLTSLNRSADDFEEAFWSGGEMNRLYSEWSGRRQNLSGIASIFVAGYREYSRLTSKSNIDRGDMIDGVHRAMRVALSREFTTVDNLDRAHRRVFLVHRSPPQPRSTFRGRQTLRAS